MIKVTITLLALVAGAIAAELCDEPVQVACRDDSYSQEKFPETKEELKEICIIYINILECIIKYEETCKNIPFIDDVRRYSRVFHELCNEETLLHAAIADNIKCYSEIEKEERSGECYMQLGSPSMNSLQKYAEALIEEGLLSLSDNELEVNNTLTCIHQLQELACYATKIEDRCGTLAMDAFVEFAQKISDVAECEEVYVYLPTVIRIYRLEEKQVDEVEDVFEKRK